MASVTEKASLEGFKVVSAAEMAAHMGISDERVRQLATEGVVVQFGRNKYDLLGSSRNYIRFLQERSRSTAAMDGDYNSWRAEKEKWVALTAKLDHSTKQGETLSKNDVQAAIGHAVVAGRRLIESAAGRLKTQFPDMTNDQILEVEKYLKRLQNDLSRIEF